MADIGDEKQVNERASKLQDLAKGRAMALRAMCLHRQGRDLLWFFMESANPYDSSMRYDDTGRGDAMRTSYAEGFRGHGTMIMGEVMRADPNAYVLMLTENRNLKEMETTNVRDSDA